MLIARIIVSSLYAALTIFAVLAEYKKSGKLLWLMLVGGVVLLAANLAGRPVSLAAAACGLLIIHIAALLNGKNSGKINPVHHVVRLLVSAVVFVLFWFS